MKQRRLTFKEKKKKKKIRGIKHCLIVSEVEGRCSRAADLTFEIVVRNFTSLESPSRPCCFLFTLHIYTTLPWQKGPRLSRICIIHGSFLQMRIRGATCTLRSMRRHRLQPRVNVPFLLFTGRSNAGIIFFREVIRISYETMRHVLSDLCPKCI